MKVKVYGYARCSSCKKAGKWLTNNFPKFEHQDFIENPLSREEIVEITKKSSLPIHRFFNTSGKLYRELKLSEQMDHLTDDEKYDLLASNGMLIKRPLLVVDDKAIPGFNETKWGELIHE